MSTEKIIQSTTDRLTISLKYSSLWLFILLNMTFRDFHELANPVFVEKMLNPNTPDIILLISGVIISFIIAMIPINIFLTGFKRRSLNIVGAAINLVGLLLILPGDLDDKWFLFMEICALTKLVYMNIKNKL